MKYMGDDDNTAEAQACLKQLERVFNEPPPSQCGLRLEMKEAARKLETQVFPVRELSLDDFSKNYPFIYISPEWAGYFLAVISHKIIQKFLAGDYEFLEDTIIEDFLSFFERRKDVLRESILCFTSRQTMAIAEALICITGFLSSPSLAEQFDERYRLLVVLETWEEIRKK